MMQTVGSFLTQHLLGTNNLSILPALSTLMMPMVIWYHRQAATLILMIGMKTVLQMRSTVDLRQRLILQSTMKMIG